MHCKNILPERCYNKQPILSHLLLSPIFALSFLANVFLQYVYTCTYTRSISCTRIISRTLLTNNIAHAAHEYMHIFVSSRLVRRQIAGKRLKNIINPTKILNTRKEETEFYQTELILLKISNKV